MASRKKANRTVSAPDNFHFERASSRIDWDRLAGTNVASLQRRGDAAMLGKFIGDVAMGNAQNDPEMEAHQTHLKAFQMLQLQTQYLLFCHQTMRERHAEVERRLAKLKRSGEHSNHQPQTSDYRLRTIDCRGLTTNHIELIASMTNHRSSQIAVISEARAWA
mmetsp:Transcript_58240/g.161475  ORF Transcript_58240/g.161475 Transcript_58240/m.161475 type:complete len:163 (+) Transcript_58240:144-632(+)